MDNPFKQFLPEGEAPEEEVQLEVMRSIQLKSYLFDILEMITAIFGLTLRDSLSVNTSPMPIEEENL